MASYIPKFSEELLRRNHLQNTIELQNGGSRSNHDMHYRELRPLTEIKQQQQQQTKQKKEIIVKRVSAFKFEIKVAGDEEGADVNSSELKIKTPDKLNSELREILLRPEPHRSQNISQKVSVIKRAPQVYGNPRQSVPVKKRTKELDNSPSPKSNDCEEIDVVSIDDDSVTVVQYFFNINDAILRRIVELLAWVLLGRDLTRVFGYPELPIHRVMWRAVRHADSKLSQDHDCGTDMSCFIRHVHHFLKICAPTKELWNMLGWTGENVGTILFKLYHEELKPYLSRICVKVKQEMKLVEDSIEEMHWWRMYGCYLVAWDGRGNSYKPHFVKPRTNVPVDMSDNSSETSDSIEILPDDSHTQAEPEVQIIDSPKSEEVKHQEQEDMQTKDNKTSSVEVKRRGRPALNGVAKIRKSKRVLLWKFVFNLVEDPKTDNCIRWINRSEGIFQILNSDWLAKTWGKSHGNPRMTYEKMSRAMRTYYRSKILEPVPRSHHYPRKLIYRINPDLIGSP